MIDISLYRYIYIPLDLLQLFIKPHSVCSQCMENIYGIWHNYVVTFDTCKILCINNINYNIL